MFEWASADVRAYGLFLSIALVIIFFVCLSLGLFRKSTLLETKLNSRERKLLAICALVVIAFAARLPFVFRNEFAFDEPYYITSSLLYTEGFNHGLGSSYFVANYEHPPLVKYMMGSYLRFFYPSIHLEYSQTLDNYDLLLLARRFSVIMGSLTIVPFFFLAERMRKGLGVVASIFLALDPSHARLSGLAYLDVTMIFFGVCAFLFFVRSLDDYRPRNLVLGGIFIGLLLATKWLQPLVYVAAMMALLVLLSWKKIHGFIFSLGVGFLVLMVFWVPLLWNFGLARIPEFLLWVHSYWTPQFTAMEGASLAYIVFWNMSVPELILLIASFVVFSVYLVVSLRRKQLDNRRLLPVFTILVFLIALQVEKRGAPYYWTMVTPFTSVVMAEAVFLLQNPIRNSFAWCRTKIHVFRKRKEFNSTK